MIDVLPLNATVPTVSVNVIVVAVTADVNVVAKLCVIVIARGSTAPTAPVTLIVPEVPALMINVSVELPAVPFSVPMEMFAPTPDTVLMV